MWCDRIVTFQLVLISQRYFVPGVLAVPRGQVDAAYALAIPRFHIWRRIITPPAIRRMMPAFVNFLTELLKATSLLSAIAVAEMAYVANILGAKNTQLLRVSLSYRKYCIFLLIFPFSLLARRSEKKLLERTGH